MSKEESVTLWLVSKEGPEWSIPVELRVTKAEAEERCKQLNDIFDRKRPNLNVYDRQSGFVCVAVPLKRTMKPNPLMAMVTGEDE